MATLLKRTANQVLSDAMTYIAANTPITNMKAGAIAQAIIAAMAPEVPSLYDYAEQVLNMGFLSQATDEYLDLIGGLFTYPRRQVTVIDPNTGDTTTTPLDDDTYRYEISQRTLTAANANYQALRLVMLAVPGVDDVIGTEYTQGTGSFSFYVITSNGYDPNAVVTQVQSVVADTKAYGVRPLIVLPLEIPVSLSVQLQFADGVTDDDKSVIRLDVTTALYNYIGNLSMGQGLIYDQLVACILNPNPSDPTEAQKILEFTITDFSIDNQPALLTDHSVEDDERLVMGSAVVN